MLYPDLPNEHANSSVKYPCPEEGNTLFIMQKRLLHFQYGVEEPANNYTIESFNQLFPRYHKNLKAGFKRYAVTSTSLAFLADIIIMDGKIVKCRQRFDEVVPVTVISALLSPGQRKAITGS